MTSVDEVKEIELMMLFALATIVSLLFDSVSPEKYERKLELSILDIDNKLIILNIDKIIILILVLIVRAILTKIQILYFTTTKYLS